MKNTGIVRQLDSVGRITLPKELRKTFGFSEREILEIYTEEDKIILQKHSEPADIFTGSTKNLMEFEGKLVSKDSVKKMAKIAGLI